MEKLVGRDKSFLASLNSLKEAISSFAQYQSHDKEYRTYRDSLIQRFEYCADLFWKYLNDQLKIKKIEIAVARPMNVLKESNSVGLLTDQELSSSIKLIEDRNRTSHAYREQLAEFISHRIAQHYDVMNAIVQRLGLYQN